MNLSLISSIVLGLPGLILFYRFGLLPEPDLELTYPPESDTVKKLRRRKKFARIAITLLILAFGFLLFFLMLSLKS